MVIVVRTEWQRLAFQREKRMLADFKTQEGTLEVMQVNLRLRITSDKSIVFDPLPD